MVLAFVALVSSSAGSAVACGGISSFFTRPSLAKASASFSESVKTLPATRQVLTFGLAVGVKKSRNTLTFTCILSILYAKVMEKNTTRPQEVKDEKQKATLAEAVLKEIRAQASEFADQLELGDSPGEKLARRWLVVGWTSGVSKLLQAETAEKYVKLVNKEKAARRRRQREAKYKILKNGGK